MGVGHTKIVFKLSDFAAPPTPVLYDQSLNVDAAFQPNASALSLSENRFPLDIAVMFPPSSSNEAITAMKTFTTSIVNSFDVSPNRHSLQLYRVCR